MKRVYNFSAGPSMLPEPVLRRAAAEMLDYEGSGQSVMEMSHRSKVYESIIFGCEEQLRRVMGIPDNYKVLFLQGGASSQFAMVPLNLLNGSGRADYVITGQFAKKAWQEASRFGQCNVVASSADKLFTYIPTLDPATFDKDADYFHICANNTIYGSRWVDFPETGNVPLVADMSSCILSEPVDVSKFGLIYAGAQKNMAPAGLTVVIIREDLLGHTRDTAPTMFNYKTMVENQSMYNTPPCYPIYICKLVLDWLESLGGLEKMAEINNKKAAVLYDFIDSSRLFHNNVEKRVRSIMNVTFVTGNEEIDKKFVKEAAAAGFVNIKGHRSVGGMRASIYNAMPAEGIDALVAFMKKFEAENA
ncbi:MAG: 3-phosphoserine/phosphohydroxythreonine transaminase [Clostridia bacterium]|nr:3-phosphoserine/phosphohydroxythreonine transaminase [Clostridia bacterium]MDR3645771.1 3-phosphoserine/phosphohydroxythreonine transaminase [Clostridia bacterium]